MPWLAAALNGGGAAHSAARRRGARGGGGRRAGMAGGETPPLPPPGYDGLRFVRLSAVCYNLYHDHLRGLLPDSAAIISYISIPGGRRPSVAPFARTDVGPPVTVQYFCFGPSWP